MKILRDLRAVAGTSPFKMIRSIFFGYSFAVVFWYRVAHFFYKMRLWPISVIIMFFHKLIFSVDVDYRCEIGGGVLIIHGLGLVIGKDVTLEENVTLYQGVTLGGNNGKSKVVQGRERTQPYICAGAKIYTGACIFGPCEIGKNSVIGARAVITSDVPANTCVYTKSERVEIPIK